MIAPAYEQTARRRASGSWMITLADLLALLLTFFVLLFSMNAVQFANWQSVIASFRKQFNPEAARVTTEPVADADAVRRFEPWGADLGYLAAVLRHKLAQPPLAGAWLDRSGDRLSVIMPPGRLVEAESGRPTPRAEAIARLLAADLGRLSNAVRIAGRFETGGGEDWAQAFARADTFAALLRRSGYDRPVVVTAETAEQGMQGGLAVEIMPTQGENGDAR